MKAVDKSKLRRQRKKGKLELSEKRKENEIDALYFDGRKDDTKVNIKKTGTYYSRTIKEEHITLITEPESKYLGHFVPQTGSAANIASGIIEFLEKEDLKTDNLIAIGCDGTNTNVGRNNGVIKLLETHFKKAFHWFVCLLHANELPLRHLLHHLDGRTKGPNHLTGPIGSRLLKCETMPVVEFRAIKVSNLPANSDELDLSKDQRYLLEICHAVSKGSCPPNLEHRNPGPLNHSRWLTTANRILRLYIACQQPTEQLITLVTFIMRVYAPTWFKIKCNPSYMSGPKNLWFMISASRYLPDELKSIIDPVIQRNAYFAHQENILVAMLSDSRTEIRELAYNRIMLTRSKEKKMEPTPREFVIPKLNFHAKEYTDLIDFQYSQRYEPPLTKKLTVNELKAVVQGKESSAGKESSTVSKRYPCHAQAVETHVKLVTESSVCVCGQKERDEFIKTRIVAREIMPKLETKSDYTCE